MDPHEAHPLASLRYPTSEILEPMKNISGR